MTIKARETEYNKILNAINTYKQTKKSQILYLSGVPGSGKTYTISYAFKDTPHTYINCNNIKSKTQIFSKISQIMKCSKKKAKTFIDLTDHLQKCASQHIIILDEIDLLITKSQSVLYNMYSMPFYENVSVLLITISNSFSMDLDAKIISRIGNNKITFKPYGSDQLIEILGNEGNSTNYIARRIGAVSGDARKAIRIHKKCKNMDINAIENDIKQKDNKMIKAFLESITILMKYFLLCDLNNQNVCDAFSRYNTFLIIKNEKEVSFDEFIGIVHRFVETGIVIIRNDTLNISLIYDEIMTYMEGS